MGGSNFAIVSQRKYGGHEHEETVSIIQSLAWKTVHYSVNKSSANLVTKTVLK
jgi:hypothetical protein